MFSIPGNDTDAAVVNALTHLQVESRWGSHAPWGALLPAILDRAWTHWLRARSGIALPLGRNLLAHSQCAQIKGE